MLMVFNTVLFKKAISDLISISDSKKEAKIEFHPYKGNNIFLAARNKNALVAAFHLKSLEHNEYLNPFIVPAKEILASLNTKSNFTEITLNIESNTLMINDNIMTYNLITERLNFSIASKEVIDFNLLKETLLVFKKCVQKENQYIHLYNGAFLYADSYYLKYHLNPFEYLKDCSFNANNLLSLEPFGTINNKKAEIHHFIGNSDSSIQYSNHIQLNEHTMRCIVDIPIERNLRSKVDFEVKNIIVSTKLNSSDLIAGLNNYLSEIEQVLLSSDGYTLNIEPLYIKLKNPKRVPQPFSIKLNDYIHPFSVKIVRKHLIAALLEGDIHFAVQECANSYSESIEVLSFNNSSSKGYITSIKSPDLDKVALKIKKQLEYQASVPYLNV